MKFPGHQTLGFFFFSFSVSCFSTKHYWCFCFFLMLNPLRGTSGIQIEKNIPDSLKRRAVVGHLHAVTVSYTMVIWHSEYKAFLSAGKRILRSFFQIEGTEIAT